MSILAVLLMQAVLTEEPAVAPTPVEPPAAASQASTATPAPAAETQQAQQPRMRCSRRAPTGQRLRVRVCDPVDNSSREEASEEATRTLQNNRFGTDPQ